TEATQQSEDKSPEQHDIHIPESELTPSPYGLPPLHIPKSTLTGILPDAIYTTDYSTAQPSTSYGALPNGLERAPVNNRENIKQVPILHSSLSPHGYTFTRENVAQYVGSFHSKE
ncbi:unnamed protein product, partial [Meganyctiphanes norvegica]